MQIVGLYLQKEAIKNHGTDRDQFARSAYNRYYYTVFLSARAMLEKLDSKWSRTPHKSYPALLNGSIAKSFRDAKSRARRNGDHELVSKLDGGIRAAQALAKVMNKAYGIRVVADYEPAEFVDFSSADRFSLKSVEITEAHGWEGAVELWTRTILQAWRQINA
jgi:hypothetical protein